MSIHIGAKSKKEIAETVLMPGDPLRAKHIAENFLEEPRLYTDVRNMLGYTGRYKGVPVSVQGSGMGMPSMGIYSWELITEYDVQNIIRVGTCGAFHENAKLKDIILAVSASTDSNYRHAFEVPNGYAPHASWSLLKKGIEVNKEMHVPLNPGNIVSCDVFYETNPNWWKQWANMGVLGVEMEAAALYMNAAYHNVNALALMTVTDHFVTGEKLTTEERVTANSDMIKFALEIAVK